MQAVCLFRTELYERQGPLLAQGLLDFTDPLRSKEEQDVYLKCMITLPYSVKPDFSEDAPKFDSNDSSTLYILRFRAFGQKFSMAKKRSTIRTFTENTDSIEANTASCTKTLRTLTENSNLITSTVSTLLY